MPLSKKSDTCPKCDKPFNVSQSLDNKQIVFCTKCGIPDGVQPTYGEMMHAQNMQLLTSKEKEVIKCAVQPSIEVEVDVLMKPKATRMVKGIIVSRKRGEFVTDTEDVQPKQAWEITNWRDILGTIKCLDDAEVPTDNRKVWFEDKRYEPIPNYPDGRYRE